MTDTKDTTFNEWCILELMGHRRLAGLVTEQEIAGKGFLRLDIPVEARPEDAVQWAATQFYSPDSVYCMTPTTEANARAIAFRSRPAPATRWELEPPRDEPDKQPQRAPWEDFAEYDNEDHPL